jgi:hypothetical protein
VVGIAGKVPAAATSFFVNARGRLLMSSKRRYSMVTMAAVWTVALTMGAGVALASYYYFSFSYLYRFPASGGVLSPYQVGFYEVDRGEEAKLFLVNPTPRYLEAFVVIFDGDEEPIACDRVVLSPNDFEDIEIPGNRKWVDGNESYGYRKKEGVVKVVTFKYSDPNGYQPYRKTMEVQPGVVGWIRHGGGSWGSSGASDTQLASVPAELLKDQNYYELKLIVNYVEENCSGDDNHPY